MSLSAHFKNRIRCLLNQYHRQINHPRLSNEREFIKRTALFFRKQTVSHGQESLISRSANIDRSPLVRFRHPTPWPNPDVREVGDLLFVIKFKKGTQIIEKRALIVQSKFTGTSRRSWKDINTAQFYLILKWPSFTRVNPGPPRPYNLSPLCLTWGTYAFVGPMATNYPLYFTSSRILGKKPAILSQKTFTFNINKPLGWDTSPSFMMRHMLCLIGENLLTNRPIESFVDDMYRIVGLIPDPPGEFKWESRYQEEPKGFGIVEFTVSLPEREE